MFGIGTTELIIIGIVAVILFGARLPSVARSLGRSLTEFKRGMSDVGDDLKETVYSDPAGHLPHDSHDDRAPSSAPPAEPSSSEPSPEEPANTPGH
jgi:sec-independent protein translocase protein TatA